jgi:hypothetical protein
MVRVSTSLQYVNLTIPHSTKVDLFCVRNKYSKHSLGQLWDAIDPKSIQPLASTKPFKGIEADATDQNV